LHYAGVVLFNSDKSGYRDKTKKTPEGHVYQGVTKILDLATPSVDFVNTLQRLRGVAAPVYRKNLLQKMLFWRSLVLQTRRRKWSSTKGRILQRLTAIYTTGSGSAKTCC